MQADGPAVDEEGWFSTGDVATIDQEGFIELVDRSKDVIKSGGGRQPACVHGSMRPWSFPLCTLLQTMP